ncbi:Protein pinocchio [Holothuria leucospilota]|uniref:Protein pinocchio n=1 Tax=Holothuria leucospilota TaxID=206669 RepID=A0A9Q1BAN7_HOLLE|nr:Protein pinocchio [Holothuria leucospilota]
MFASNAECSAKTSSSSNIPSFAATFAQQISPEEFDRQKVVYTKQAVAELQNSEEFKRWLQKCSCCSSSWYDGQFSTQCQECGGFAMSRPCGICLGHCGATWYRDIDMSHKMKEGHWNGKCYLPESEQRHFILQHLVGNDEDTLVDALTDLGNT